MKTSNSLFELELEEFQEAGETAKWNPKGTANALDASPTKNTQASSFRYRLRHMNSGSLVYLQTVTKDGQEQHILVLCEPSRHDNPSTQAAYEEQCLKNSLFSLLNFTFESDPCIKKESVIKLKNC